MDKWIDWQIPFGILLPVSSVERIVEFGMGRGTGFFLERRYRTTSIELASKEEHKEWYEKCCEDYKGNRLWESYIYHCEENFEPKVEKYIIDRITNKKYDLIFVDPGVHFRADIVNLCFGKANIIATHDTNYGPETYMWEKIKKHKDYVHVKCSLGQGTSFWIKDKKFANKIQEIFKLINLKPRHY